MSDILIIEDDLNILDLERDYLEAAGYKTDYATDGAQGLNMALKKRYDLILLDIMLPGLDGFQACKKIRASKDVPIILVSAKKEDMDKITGLGLGADDYMVKPFSPGELVARVTAHIKRYRRLTGKANESESGLRVEGLTLNPESAVARLNGKELNLTKKEFNVLYLLASQPDTVISKNELFEKVWGYDSLGDTSTLTVHINRLRDKLKEADPYSNYIKTIWGRGYRFR